VKITLLTVGKTEVDWVRKGLDLYSARLPHYAKFSLEEIPDVKNAATLPKVDLKKKEGEKILEKVKSSDFMVVLDEHGREFRSVEFAKWMEDKMNVGRDMVFVVGGAFGFSDEVYSRADFKMSLSQMTFSHQMVRVLFAEQIYRAFTIIKGEPYHNE